MNNFVKITFVIGVTLGLASFAVIDGGEDTIENSKSAVESKINFFEGSWEDALKMAKDENKIIFLDAMASWCGPCKLMAAKTFTDPTVAKYYNEHFINIKMDMENHPDGPDLAKKFEVGAYPTLIFVDKSGKIVKKSLGYKDPKQFLELGKSVK